MVNVPASALGVDSEQSQWKNQMMDNLCAVFDEEKLIASMDDSDRLERESKK